MKLNKKLSNLNDKRETTLIFKKKKVKQIFEFRNCERNVKKKIDLNHNSIQLNLQNGNFLLQNCQRIASEGSKVCK